MNKIVIVGVITLLNACTGNPVKHPPESQACEGTTQLPATLSASFTAVENPALLASALGKPEKGSLCQGQVYRANADTRVAIYRAWNSTNPGSVYGHWWAFTQPTGSIAQYRENFEICYQWSPLDKLVTCTLKAGTEVVVGNGQSARCSEYLTYPVSAIQQVYLADAADSTHNCTQATAVFGWQ